MSSPDSENATPEAASVPEADGEDNQVTTYVPVAHSVLGERIGRKKMNCV